MFLQCEMKGLDLKVTQVLSSYLRCMTLKVPPKKERKQKEKRINTRCLCLPKSHLSARAWMPPSESRPNLRPRGRTSQPHKLFSRPQEAPWSHSEAWGRKAHSTKNQPVPPRASPFGALGKCRPSLPQNGLVYGKGETFLSSGA